MSYNGNKKPSGLIETQVLGENDVFIVQKEGESIVKKIKKEFLGIASSWGQIAGNISDQSDLQAALDEKADGADLTSHMEDKENPHEVTKEQVGLGNVDNTSDANKPVSVAQLAALDLKISLSEKAANNGVATLDAGGKIPAGQLPNTVMEFKGTYDASTNDPELEDGVGDAGDVYLVSVAGTQDLGSGAIELSEGDWLIYNGFIWQKSINSNAVVSVNGQQGVVVLNVEHIGGLVDALNAKADSTALSDHVNDTSNPHGVTKAQVGLANVTNDAQLKIASNLADLTDASTARNNLGLGTMATQAEANYALLAGRAGGQTLKGGTGVTDALTLQGTSGNGTAGSPAIQLKTGNNGATTALTVLNNGNVVIGITNPGSKLYVQGGSALTGNAPSGLSGAVVSDNVQALGSGTGTMYGVVGLAKSTGDVSGDKVYGGYFAAASSIQASAQVGIHVKTTSTSGAATPAEFYAGANPMMVIAATGNTTLGSHAGPAGLLTVKGLQETGDSNLIALDKGSHGISYIGARHNTSGNGGLIFGDGSTNTMFVGTASGNRNVGIGTTNPSNKLHISLAEDGSNLFGEGITINRGSGSLTLAQGSGHSSEFFPQITGVSTRNIAGVGGLNLNGTPFADTTSFPSVVISGSGSNSPILDVQKNGPAGTSYLTVGNSGNVGIGTTNPGTKLHVVGNANIGSIPVNLGNNNTDYPVIGYNLAFTGSNRTYNYRGSDTAYLIDFGADTGTRMRFNVASAGTAGNQITFTEAMSILTSGNVGIGTTNPSERLHVSGNLLVTGNSTTTSATTTNLFSTNATFTNLISDNITSGTILPSTDNTYDLGSSAIRWKTVHVGPGSLVVHNDATDTLKATLGFSGSTAKLFTDAATPLQITTGTNTGLNIDTTGNVGIGLTEPSHRFVVNRATSGTTAGSGIISRFQGANEANGRTEIGFTYEGASGTSAPVLIGYQSTSHTGFTKGNFYIATRDVTTDTAPTERLVILPNGNVGIGTTNPLAVLHLKAGTAAANTAPLAFTSGTLLTTPVSGRVEYNNTFHLTNSDNVRRHIVTAPNATKVTAGAPYANDGYVVMNIGGTDFNVMTTAG
jgi:hypothetical protein